MMRSESIDLWLDVIVFGVAVLLEDCTFNQRWCWLLETNNRDIRPPFFLCRGEPSFKVYNPLDARRVLRERKAHRNDCLVSRLLSIKAESFVDHMGASDDFRFRDENPHSKHAWLKTILPTRYNCADTHPFGHLPPARFSIVCRIRRVSFEGARKIHLGRRTVA